MTEFHNSIPAFSTSAKKLDAPSPGTHACLCSCIIPAELARTLVRRILLAERAFFSTTPSTLCKTFAVRLCSSRSGATLQPSAKRFNAAGYSGGIPAELFEKLVRWQRHAQRGICAPFRDMKGQFAMAAMSPVRDGAASGREVLASDRRGSGLCLEPCKGNVAAAPKGGVAADSSGVPSPVCIRLRMRTLEAASSPRRSVRGEGKSEGRTLSVHFAVQEVPGAAGGTAKGRQRIRIASSPINKPRAASTLRAGRTYRLRSTT